MIRVNFSLPILLLIACSSSVSADVLGNLFNDLDDRRNFEFQDTERAIEELQKQYNQPLENVRPIPEVERLGLPTELCAKFPDYPGCLFRPPQDWISP